MDILLAESLEDASTFLRSHMELDGIDVVLVSGARISHGQGVEDIHVTAAAKANKSFDIAMRTILQGRMATYKEIGLTDGS